MDPRARRTYRSIGWAFLVVAAAVVAVRVGEAVFGYRFFRGSPLGTAIFLAAIGALLVWTVRGGDDEDAPREETPPPRFKVSDLGSVRPSGGAVDGIPPEAPEPGPADARADGETESGAEGRETEDPADTRGSRDGGASRPR